MHFRKWVMLMLSRCHGSANTGWKIISRYRAFQNGVSSLKTKSRDKVGTASAMCKPSDRPGRVIGRENFVLLLLYLLYYFYYYFFFNLLEWEMLL